MTTLNIKQLNPVTAKALDKETIQIIKPMLSYEAVYWKPRYTGYGRESRPYRKNFIDTRNGKFWAGFQGRILERAHLLGHTVKWQETDCDIALKQPYIPGITLRDDQKKLLEAVLIHRRGVLKAPPRTGKTVVAAGLISSLEKPRALFMVHSKDLLSQTHEEFTRFGIPCGRLGGGYKELDPPVTIATHQSMIKQSPDYYCLRYDMVLVDECHHVSAVDGNYAKILKTLAAPIRIGLTATPSEQEGKFMVMEGLLGPIIAETTQKETLNRGLTAEAQVRLLRVPEHNRIKSLRTYQEAYLDGVVRNRARNRIIVKTALNYMGEGNTVLILVTRVLHGFCLEDMFQTLYPDHDVPFVCSDIDVDTRREIQRVRKRIDEMTNKANKTKLEEYLDQLLKVEGRVRQRSQERDAIRHALIDKKISCVIATNIWNEGINLPSLGVVINAGGGKSEIRTIQIASRSLTKAVGKEKGIIVDLFDPNGTWFISHFGERVCMYMEQGWM